MRGPNPSRRRLLKQGVLLGVAAIGAPALAGELRLADLPAARTAIRQLQARSALQSSAGMSPYRTLVHCAQSIEYSLSGYPQLKPRWFRASLGRSAAQYFLWRGAMQHDLDAPLPGAPVIAANGSLREAFARLHRALDAFELAAAQGRPLAEHFAYGPLPADQYARLHAYHLAEHLGSLGLA